MDDVDNKQHSVAPDPQQQHRLAWELIPWVLNGTAAPSERELVLGHLQRCGDCRAEYEFQQHLRQGLELAGPPAGLDEARALRSFWTGVEHDEQQQGRQDPTPSPLLPVAPSRRGLQRWLAAAVVVQAVGLAGLAAVLGLRSGPAAAPAPYQVLSQPAAGPAGASIRVVPAPGLQIGELRALLARSDLQLVQASSDAGHLGLALAPAARFDRAQAVLRLRAEPGILLAEPITTDGR